MVKMFRGLPLYSGCILDLDEGLMDVSLVDSPAILKDFIFFSSQEEIKFQVQDEEQHIVSGPIMIPETPIFRRLPDGTEYYITFSKDTLKEAVLRMGKENKFNSVTLNHDGKLVEGVTLVEIFLKDSSKGINPNYVDVPDGSIFASYKVENKEVWNLIKSGAFRGFSISGLFSVVPQKSDLDEVLDLLAKVKVKYKL